MGTAGKPETNIFSATRAAWRETKIELQNFAAPHPFPTFFTHKNVLSIARRAGAGGGEGSRTEADGK